MTDVKHSPNLRLHPATFEQNNSPVPQNPSALQQDPSGQCPIYVPQEPFVATVAALRKKHSPNLESQPTPQCSSLAPQNPYGPQQKPAPHFLPTLAPHEPSLVTGMVPVERGSIYEGHDHNSEEEEKI